LNNPRKYSRDGKTRGYGRTPAAADPRLRGVPERLRAVVERDREILERLAR
jgi:hypothetical protein